MALPPPYVVGAVVVILAAWTITFFWGLTGGIALGFFITFVAFVLGLEAPPGVAVYIN